MVILEDHIYIFGGDRHRMCFNDLYLRSMTDICDENQESVTFKGVIKENQESIKSPDIEKTFN